jgi:hypothetical protein
MENFWTSYNAEFINQVHDGILFDSIPRMTKTIRIDTLTAKEKQQQEESHKKHEALLALSSAKSDALILQTSEHFLQQRVVPALLTTIDDPKDTCKISRREGLSDRRVRRHYGPACAVWDDSNIVSFTTFFCRHCRLFRDSMKRCSATNCQTTTLRMMNRQNRCTRG